MTPNLFNSTNVKNCQESKISKTSQRKRQNFTWLYILCSFCLCNCHDYHAHDHPLALHVLMLSCKRNNLLTKIKILFIISCLSTLTACKENKSCHIYLDSKFLKLSSVQKCSFVNNFIFLTIALDEA